MRLRVFVPTVALLAGCYQYTLLPSSVPTPGETVRLSLTGDGTDRVTRLYGPGISQLDGKVVGARPDTVDLAVRVARTPAGIQSYFQSDTVALPLSAVASITKRKVAVGPTVLLGGLVIGGTVGAAVVLGGGSVSGNTQPPGGGTVGAQ